MRTSDFDIPEEVVSSEATGEKKFRGGTVYPLEIFEDRFDVKKRKTMSYQKEKDDDGKDTVRVFDDVPGVFRFENYEDKSTAHKKVIADSKLLLSKDQVRNNYEAARDESFHNDKCKKSACLPDLGVEVAPNKMQDRKKEEEKKAGSDPSEGSSSSSDSEAPLAKSLKVPDAQSTKKGGAKAKCKVKALASPAVAITDGDDPMEDVATTIGDKAFLRQTQMKVVVAEQVLDHIRTAP